MPEQIVSDVEEKSDKHDAKNVRIIIAAVLIISGMINLLVPGVIPYNIPSIWSFIGIGAGVGMLTSVKKGKIKRGRTVVVSEKNRKRTRFPMMIYVMRRCCYQTICRRLIRKRL